MSRKSPPTQSPLSPPDRGTWVDESTPGGVTFRLPFLRPEGDVRQVAQVLEVLDKHAMALRASVFLADLADLFPDGVDALEISATGENADGADVLEFSGHGWKTLPGDARQPVPIAESFWEGLNNDAFGVPWDMVEIILGLMGPSQPRVARTREDFLRLAVSVWPAPIQAQLRQMDLEESVPSSRSLAKRPLSRM